MSGCTKCACTLSKDELKAGGVHVFGVCGYDECKHAFGAHGNGESISKTAHDIQNLLKVELKSMLEQLMRTPLANSGTTSAAVFAPVDNKQQDEEASKLMADPQAQSVIEDYLKKRPPLRWKCFLSHVQKEAQDACRALGRYLKDKECSVWYDKEAGRLDLLGMIEGIAGSAAFIIYGTKSYFSRPWCLFELKVARKLGKPIITLRETDDRAAPLSFMELRHYDELLADHEIIDVSRDYYDAFIDKVLGRVFLAHSAVQDKQAGDSKVAHNEAASKYNQGLKYLYGSADVTKDSSKAVELLQEAAKMGHAEAQFRLAICYRDGLGVTKNEEKTAQLWQQAADQKHAEAQANLGYFYSTGKGGLTRDELKALQLFQLAADQGNATGQANLGLYYERGKGGLVVNETKALELFRQAADQGNSMGQANLGSFYTNGKGGLQPNQPLGREHIERSAEQGNPQALSSLGVLYANGRGGLPHDDVKAAALFQQAADAGNERGYTNLGWFYEEGRGGLPKDEAKAVKYYQIAADMGDAGGQAYLATNLEFAIGVPRDLQKAIVYYRKAAAQHDSTAIAALQRLELTL
eukprot:gb/GEZN01005256.1/.p1 GENE.gb/GEZN01005256.1/~~gb/GEZN01005256.1/.p1  ORF type:complete len:589 (-),score=120.54 gb/GEZN01005256.1/:64-1803(-)